MLRSCRHPLFTFCHSSQQAFQLLVTGNGFSFEGGVLGREQRLQFRANLKLFLSRVRVLMRIK